MTVLATVSPNASAIQTVLRGFLSSILPAMEIVEGQDNRVAEPGGPDFVIFTSIRRARLATNLDAYTDKAFVGSIAGNILTISSVITGALAIGDPVLGAGIFPGITVASLGTGTGGVGTYVLSSVVGTITSETIQCGTTSFTESVELTFQLDVHGPNSSDNAQVISTMFRDDFAYQAFISNLAAPSGTVTPIEADEPRQMPFDNAEQQVEYRWVVYAKIQADQTITFPQQFAATLGPVGLIPADVLYPA